MRKYNDDDFEAVKKEIGGINNEDDRKEFWRRIVDRCGGPDIKTKYQIYTDVGCDNKGCPVFHREDIESNDIHFVDVHVNSIHEKDGKLKVKVIEDFNVETIEISDLQKTIHAVYKNNHITSKKVGKNALRRCFNCTEADNCTSLIGDSTAIRHTWLNTCNNDGVTINEK